MYLDLNPSNGAVKIPLLIPVIRLAIESITIESFP